MKQYSIMFIALFSASSYADVRVVPEAVLNGWGYKTVKSWGYRPENADYAQFIKRIEIADGYYPRFALSKSCFSSNAEAQSENLRIIKEIKKGPDQGHKTYRNILIEDGCLFQVYTESNLFYLYYQPDIVEKLKGYVSHK